MGRDCMDRASYAWHKITQIPGVEPAFNRRFFNEFSVRLPKDASDVVSALVDQGIAAGFPVGRYYEGMENILLLAFTEKRTKEEIDIMVAKLETALKA